LKVSKAGKSDRIDVPSHGVRDEQLAAAVGKKPKFDSKTLWKFYLQPVGSQTAKLKRGS